jgi:hypothetical protein
MAASAVGMIWPRSRSAVQGIGLLGATLYWYRCAKIMSESGAANADGMAAKDVGMIWPRSRSASNAGHRLAEWYMDTGMQ